MQTVKSEVNIFFDVDDTLVIWGLKREETSLSVVDPYDNKIVYLGVHNPHVKLLKNHFARGSYVTVWSANGYRWAEVIIRALQLENYVHLVMSKPRAHVDDKPCADWMGEHVYINPNAAWGNQNG